MAIRLGKLKNKSTNDRSLYLKRTFVHLMLKALWAISPSLAVRLVNKHLFTPAGYHISTIEREVLKSATRFQIDLHGETVHGWKWGQGPGVLLVHGWNGRGIQLHRFFRPLLQAGLSVITFDAPGHGVSEGNSSSYFQFTDTIRAMLNPQNGFNIKGMVGYSLGGAAVINALSKENSTVPTVLIAPALKLEEILFNTFNSYGLPAKVYRNAIAAYERRYGYDLHNDDPHKLLASLNSNLLIIHDQQDREIPFVDSKTISEKWPRIELHATKGQGHRRILKDRGVVAVTAEFLATQIGLEMPSLLEAGLDSKTDPFIAVTAAMKQPIAYNH